MPARTPAFIQRFVDDNQYRCDLPSQFYGDEPNSVRKPWDSAKVRCIITASWPYEAAAGNQSVPAVYMSINEHENYLCDRFYLPATARDLRMFDRAGVPVFGIESKHQLMDFDVVSTSIAYPILTLSFHKYLTMSDIPVHRQERERRGAEKYPMIMIGGQVYGAPETIAPIVDCLWLGEVEDEPGNGGIGKVFQRIEMFKAEGLWQTERVECYRQLALEFNYLYFPRFIDVEYEYEDRKRFGAEQPSKQVVAYTSSLPGMRLPFLKRIVKNMDAVKPLARPPLLFSDPSMGAGDLEVGRGCPAWCSFCALTYRQKPYRQRSVPYMIEYAKEFQDRMGGVNLAPFMPDFPMHTQRKRLIKALLENVSDEVDAPAMRVDDFIADTDFILLQVGGGMDHVTLGLEGNSQRMRDLIGKGCADEDAREAVTSGIRAGMRKFKFFMISNMPGEDEGDVFRILRLAKDLADIRDNLGQPGVRIQFSWTPLLIEANTPMQWFAPTVGSRSLSDVWEEFKSLKIEFKLGSKSEPNKAAYFQACQRSSRDVGEALVEVMDELNQACWGGMPKHTKALLATKLKKWGFHNAYDDIFDEREKRDMFGWEFVDQGVSTELMWVTYQQMREFLEDTDSHTYDLAFDDDYHGSEWIARCDTQCLGKSCGVCDFEDLKQRTQYIRAAQREEDIDLSTIRPVNQTSQAVKVRARIVKSERHRFVMNDHWRYNVRRAAYLAQREIGSEYGISKRSIRFASDALKYKDWTCGVDYVEFGMTARVTDVQLREFVGLMNKNMRVDEDDESTASITIVDWRKHPGAAAHMGTDVDLALFDLELEVEPSVILQKIRQFEESEYVKLTLHQDTSYFTPGTEEVNAKDYVRDLWLRRDGHRLLLRMLVRGRPSPYQVYAALVNRQSWLDVADKPAVRVDAFVEAAEAQADFLRPSCVDCEILVPVNVLDEPYNAERCPRCLDRHEGNLVSAESLVG